MPVNALIPKGRDVINKLYWLSKASRLAPGQDYSRSLSRMPDGIWFWCFTGGYRRFSVLRSLLPGMPDEETQIHYVGSCGDAALREAFQAYSLFRKKTSEYHEPLGPDSHVLDFGCGWGRFIRFFLRDVPAANLVGVDCSPDMIELCKQTNMHIAFSLSRPLPPIDLPDNKFDLIYLYSVFSHLSEKAVEGWVSEFRRILKPGGMLIATTRARKFINECEGFRNGKPGGYPELKEAFVGTSEWLARYDRGEFCFASYPAVGGSPPPEYYGESCIPREYVETKWTDRFNIREFIFCEEMNLEQNVIVAQKK